MELGLRGRSALITGGSKGIGLAIARQLAAEGCDLVLVARGAAALEDAAAGLRATANVRVSTEVADMALDETALRLAATYADIDILVNNAGAIPGGAIDQVEQEQWRAAWDLKVFGYIGLTRAFYIRMKALGRGVILNIIGAAGERMDADYVAGSAANAGLMALTRALGAGAPAHGLRVVGINPGPVATERLEFLQRKKAEKRFGDPERWRELVGAMPFGRAARPEEIGAMAAFLVSDLSGYTTGTIVTIDGGLSNRA